MNMPTEEFERYMSGEAVPHDPNKVYTCDGLQLMKQNLQTLSEIRERQERLMADALQLQQDMLDFKDHFRREIQDVLDRTPLKIKPKKTKVDIDEEASDSDMLPPPLLPEVMTGHQVPSNIPCQAGSMTSQDPFSLIPNKDSFPPIPVHSSDTYNVTAPIESCVISNEATDSVADEEAEDQQSNGNIGQSISHVVDSDADNSNITETETASLLDQSNVDQINVE